MNEDDVFRRLFDSVLGPIDEQALARGTLKLGECAIGVLLVAELTREECKAVVLELRKLKEIGDG